MSKMITDNIPMGVVVTLIIQTGALFYWGGAINERVAATTAELQKHEVSDDISDDTVSSVNQRLTVVERVLKLRD